MKTQTSLLYLWLAVLPAPISAQTSPAASETQAATSLNLSLPRNATRPAPFPLAGEAADDPVARNLRPDSGRLPYGSGYEVRQRGMSANANAQPATHQGSGTGKRAGSGAGGKGGMGRGR